MGYFHLSVWFDKDTAVFVSLNEDPRRRTMSW